MSILALTACSDDDDDRVVRPVETAKHFTGNDLDLKFSGEKVIGKDVLFTPDAEKAESATLTFLGERFDVESAMQRAAEAKGYLTSSVFAGEPEVSLPITMTLQGDMGTFEGNGESKYYTYSYKGSVIENQLAVEFTNVLLKNNKLGGTAWALEPIVTNDWGMVESTPLTFQWDSEKKVAVEMFGSTTEYTMTQLLAVVMSMPVIPVDDKTKVTIPQILTSLLQEVKFENDGNLIATYMDMDSKAMKTSAKGIAQYVIANDKTIKLILNPFAIAADASKNPNQKPESEMSNIMKALTPTILAALNADVRLSEGIDINYTLDGDKLQATVDETLLLPVLKLFAPMLQNPDLINTIVEKVKQNPEMAAMAPMLESLLKQFPEVINTTSKIELGLKFNKK